jgi:hypothetical protein
MTADTKQFIENHIEWIENNEFEKIYSNDSLEAVDRSELTQILLSIGLDPLQHLTFVPANYLSESNIKQFVVPSHIDRISSAAFWECRELEKVTLPEGLIFIEDSAFAECHKLAQISLPSTLEYIYEDAFAETALKHVIIPDNVAKVSRYCFEECKQLETVKLGKYCTRLGSGAFCNCEKLRHVQLNEGLELIVDFVFKNCKELKEIYIPSTVNKIGMYSFYDCDPELKIICIENSYAHKYAEQTGMEFELI